MGKVILYAGNFHDWLITVNIAKIYTQWTFQRLRYMYYHINMYFTLFESVLHYTVCVLIKSKHTRVFALYIVTFVLLGIHNNYVLLLLRECSL